MKQTARIVFAFLMLAVTMLAGCKGQSIMDAVFPQQSEILIEPEETVIPEEIDSLQESSTPELPEIHDLTVWVPPNFDPESESMGLLKSRLINFSKDHSNVNLNVRVKSASGPGSIIETLINASEVATDAVPSLVLINRNDLILSASKDLLFPVEGLTEVIDEQDWFDISLELGRYQGIVYCMPMATNTLAMISKDAIIRSDPPTWDEIIRQSDKLIFAAGDAESLVSVVFYQSAGGVLSDSSSQPVLDPVVLEKILTNYSVAARNQRFPNTILDYQTDDQAWEAFQSIAKGVAFTWANHALVDKDSYQLALLPSQQGAPYTIADGWFWCLTEPDEQDRVLSVNLVEYLVNPDFLASWAGNSGYLPVRPSSISGYQGVKRQDIITRMLLSADVRPNKNLTIEIGVEIKKAISEVILKTSSPELSAKNAVDRLEALRNQ